MPEDDHTDLPPSVAKELKKLGIAESVWERSISPEEIQYLLDHCPYLQMISVNPVSAFPDVKLITGASGWSIHHYGDALSSSAGEFLYGGGDFAFSWDDDDDGDGGAIVNPRKGSIIKQAFDTAAEMVALAHAGQWGGVQIVDGHPMMQWAAWMAASDLDLSLSGYTPSEQAKAKRARIKRTQAQDAQHRRGLAKK